LKTNLKYYKNNNNKLFISFSKLKSDCLRKKFLSFKKTSYRSFFLDEKLNVCVVKKCTMSFLIFLNLFCFMCIICHSI
jgi:hypothetical protein